MNKRNEKSNWRNINQMKDTPSFGDAMNLDQAIYQLAAYDTSAGMIIMPDNQDEHMLYQKGVAKRFNHFKRLLQNNEMSFLDLQRMVISRSGPFPSRKHNFTSEEAIADAVESVIKESNKPEPEPDFVVIKNRSGLNSVIQKLLEDIINSDPDGRGIPNESDIIEGSVEDVANSGITIEGLFTKKKDSKGTEKNNERRTSPKSIRPKTKVRRKPKRD